MSGLEHRTYRNTALHIAKAEIQNDDRLMEIGRTMSNEQKELLMVFAGRMIEIGMETEAGLEHDLSRSNDLTHNIEIYLQGAAEAKETN